MTTKRNQGDGEEENKELWDENRHGNFSVS
jgi:hypothetical protein